MEAGHGIGTDPTPAPALPCPCQAHIVGPEVWVVLLNAVIQDRDHDAPARQPLAPDLQDVQVRLHLVVLCQVGLESVGLWNGPAPPPGLVYSPCTIAWRTRDPWAPPRSVLPATVASAAQTTAPGGGHVSGRGLVPSTLPSHPCTLE